MVIDISDILMEVGSSKQFDGNVIIKDITYQGDKIHFDSPFYVKGNVTNVGQLLVMNAHLEGIAALKCGKCTESYDYSVDYDIKVNFKSTTDEEDPDIYVYTNNRIDLYDIVIREFLHRLPILRRCSQECKGLCPYCGTNLNNKECQCSDQDHEPIDSRFSVLRDFFVDRDREV
ncbi:MAG: DUF177 domain-containing protein [Clostridiales bacterium]|nr:DUF177 domain-containing protein [Clostridiales bacterium]